VAGGHVQSRAPQGRVDGPLLWIYLPWTQEAVEAKEKLITEKIAKGTETVLLVGDEESFLHLGKAVLERFGYTVLAACKPGEALAMTEQYEGPIHLLVTGVVMPEMNGKELMMRIEKLKPNIKVPFHFRVYGQRHHAPKNPRRRRPSPPEILLGQLPGRKSARGVGSARII
jgi:CheY-like chemotaxis protein